MDFYFNARNSLAVPKLIILIHNYLSLLLYITNQILIMCVNVNLRLTTCLYFSTNTTILKNKKGCKRSTLWLWHKESHVIPWHFVANEKKINNPKLNKHLKYSLFKHSTSSSTLHYQLKLNTFSFLSRSI